MSGAEQTAEIGAPETLVFSVRRYSAISDRWSLWGEDFDNAVETLTERILDPKNGLTEMDVVEVQVVRRTRLSAVVQSIAVNPVMPPGQATE